MVGRQGVATRPRCGDDPKVTVGRDAPPVSPGAHRGVLLAKVIGHRDAGLPDFKHGFQDEPPVASQRNLHWWGRQVNAYRVASTPNVARMDAHERLRQARVNAGFANMADAARRFGWEITTYRGHENGSRGIKRPSAEAYARAYRVPVAWLMFGEGEPTKKGVPLVGYVGAGAEVFPVDDGGALDWIDPMPGIGPEAVAVRVRGNSMFPRYFDGDVLIYDQHIPVRKANGQECVVRLTDGRVYVKTVRCHASGLVTLESFNAPTIAEADVEWTAPVLWVRRSLG